jgi:hypothetical protein
MGIGTARRFDSERPLYDLGEHGVTRSQDVIGQGEAQMTSPLEPTFGYLKDKLAETCDNCGAGFEVVAPGQKGHEESEEYNCPECKKTFTIRASNSPRVRLLSARTDGKTDYYKG